MRTPGKLLLDDKAEEVSHLIGGMKLRARQDAAELLTDGVALEVAARIRCTGGAWRGLASLGFRFRHDHEGYQSVAYIALW